MVAEQPGGQQQWDRMQATDTALWEEGKSWKRVWNAPQLGDRQAGVPFQCIVTYIVPSTLLSALCKWDQARNFCQLRCHTHHSGLHVVRIITVLWEYHCWWNVVLLLMKLMFPILILAFIFKLWKYSSQRSARHCNRSTGSSAEMARTSTGQPPPLLTEATPASPPAQTLPPTCKAYRLTLADRPGKKLLLCSRCLHYLPTVFMRLIHTAVTEKKKKKDTSLV